MNASEIHCIKDTCNFRCSTCANNSNNCSICADVRINPPNCDCPDNFYDANVAACSACIFPCLNCTSNTDCTSCVPSTPERI